MTKKLTAIALCLALFITLGACSASHVHAATKSASPSATPAATTESQATQNLRDRIEKVVSEKRNQIMGVIDKLGRRPRGFVGQVQRVTQETLSVKNQKGTQLIPLDESITLLKAGKRITVDDIAVDDWVIVLGFMQDEDTFEPVRILVSSQSLRPKPYMVILGSVNQVDKINLTVAARSGQSTVAFTLDKNTSYEDLSGNKLTLKDITPQTQVLAIGYTQEGKVVATVIKLLTTVESTKP